MSGPGRLVLVVGPSGAGKDSLIDGARAHLRGDPRFVFPRRTITRPDDAGGEDHEPATLADFEARERVDGFALSWRAHGLAYGVPISIAADLDAGRTVVVNVSRAAIEGARRRFPSVRVLNVTAPPDVLAERLASRGRETADDVRRRLARAAAPPDGPDTVEVVNDGALEAGVARFLRALAVG